MEQQKEFGKEMADRIVLDLGPVATLAEAEEVVEMVRQRSILRRVRTVQRRGRLPSEKKKEETKTIQFLEFHGRRIRRHQPRESSTWHNVIVVVGDVELIEIENSSTVLKDAVDLLSASSRRRPHGVALVAAPALGRRQPLSKRTSTKTR